MVASVINTTQIGSKAFLLLLFASFIFAKNGQCASFTSSESGNWNASSTWGGSGIPGTGDTATISSGHQVTIPSGVTVSSTVVFTNSTPAQWGRLSIAGTFTMEGDTALRNYNELVLRPGGRLELNNESIDVRTSAENKLTLEGSPTNRATITATGAYGRIYGGNSGGGVGINWEYVDFQSLGNCTLNVNPSESGWIIDHCTFTDCGRLYLGGRFRGSIPFRSKDVHCVYGF